jgi:limonene-1,2-epoxide hydrolase
MAFVTAINRRDPRAIARLTGEGYTFIDSRGAEHTGRSNALAGWRQYFRIFPDYEIKVDHVAEGAGFAALFGSARGTYNGRRGLVPRNRIWMPAAWRAVAKDGRIVIWQVYADWTEGIRIMEEDAKSG